MPKKHQNDPRSAKKRPQEEPKTTKKAIPNDKTKTGPNQDDLGTVLDRPKGPDHQFVRAPGGSFGRPKRHQNRSQNDQKSKQQIKRQHKKIRDDLGPVLERSWIVLGRHLAGWQATCRASRRSEAPPPSHSQDLEDEEGRRPPSAR